MTAAPFVQVPFVQVATPLHKSPSSQFVPSVTGVFETLPVVGSQESAVQGLPSSTLVAAPGTHVPLPSHLSPLVQALPSSQPVLAADFAYTQVPATHVPAASKHGGGVEQFVVHGGLHWWVAALQPNGHVVFVGVYVQPVPDTHSPSAPYVTRVWGSEQNAVGGVAQMVGTRPTQSPVTSQLSEVVQGSPSSHAVPVVTCLYEQVPALQVPVAAKHWVFNGSMHLTPPQGLQTTAAFCGKDVVALNRKSTELSSVSRFGEQPPSFRS